MDGWILLQKRGQFENPDDYFSSKLWNDYENGFGNPKRGKIPYILEYKGLNIEACFRVLAWIEEDGGYNRNW